MEDVRMSHAFDLKNLVVMPPYVIRDSRVFLVSIRVKLVVSGGT